MKAITLQTNPAQPPLRLVDMPAPERTGPKQALVRVLEVGLDGTDKELLHSRTTVAATERGDLVLGHELLGRVLEVGPQCESLRPGDLVTALVRRPCPDADCVYCRSGRLDYCASGRFTERGIKEADGFLAETIVEEEKYLVKVPEELAALGVLIEPQSVLEKALDAVEATQRRLEAPWTPRSALVLGAGPLGVLAAMTLRLLGCETDVYSLEPPDRQGPKLVREAGCRYVQGGKDASPADLGKRWDLIFECTGYSPLAFSSIGLLKRNGALAVLGVAAQTGVSIAADGLMRSLMTENLAVIGSANASPANFGDAMTRLAEMRRRFPGVAERIVTDRLRPEDVPNIDFSRLALKAVVEMEVGPHPSP